MTTATITRRLTLDAGHRVPGHLGKCRNLHGHTYVIEVEVIGVIPEDGMVLDFGVVKEIMVEQIGPWDHAFLCYRDDRMVLDALAVDPTWRRVLLPWPPTAENLARFAADALRAPLRAAGVTLSSVTVHETPNCRATWREARAL